MEESLSEKNKVDKTVVILSMAKSGSSFLSSVVNALGIYMGELEYLSLREDEEFHEIEEKFLAYVNKDYWNPPNREEFVKIEEYFKNCMLELITSRSDKRLWGWKNPRTALSIRIWHPYLENPHYIWLRRSMEGTVGALIRRYPKSIRTVREWKEIVDYCTNEIRAFLVEYFPSYITVNYEDCFENLELQVKRISTFLEVPYKDCSDLLNRNLGKSWIEINENY